MTKKELAELATQRSITEFGRISPAYIEGYMRGFHESEECHEPVEIPLREK